ncbi:MAG: DUF3100 domain-containing protein [Synergistaceae bacterium]|jgi:hypothetical protein|nr:DUF3100 domain-containing protein [Synergistaceae bacterium]
MEDSLQALKSVKVHVLTLILTILCEFLGTKIIPLPVGAIVFFPMLYALLLGFVIGLPRLRILKLAEQEEASYLINISVMLLIARYGTLVGPNFFKIIDSGLALILQEFGNLGTAFCAIPVAVWLGLKRETVGACFSNARENSLALISEVYGLNSPEGRGIMGVYICGTVFGSIFYGLMASIIASLGIFSVESQAMAAGTGSASMMTATIGALQALYPEKGEIIAAYGAASNMLTSLDGLYMSLFIGLPMSNWLYRVCCRVKYGADSESAKS